MPNKPNESHMTAQIILNAMPGGGDTTATTRQATATPTMSSAPISRARDRDLKVCLPCASVLSTISDFPESNCASGATGCADLYLSGPAPHK